jgi:hypothetical protein
MRVLLSNTGPHADFSEVLETACRSAGIDFDAATVAPSNSLRNAASRLHELAERERERRTSALFASLQSYFDQQSELRTPRIRKPADPQSVADELRISAGMTLADLSRLRRQFALANHPDRVGASEREIATRRMMIANMLIDRERKRRHAKSTLSTR